jgi:hypothetical protein
MEHQKHTDETIIDLALTLMKLGLLILKLKKLGISAQAISFLREGCTKANKELTKIANDFEFEKIIKGLKL